MFASIFNTVPGYLVIVGLQYGRGRGGGKAFDSQVLGIAAIFYPTLQFVMWFGHGSIISCYNHPPGQLCGLGNFLLKNFIFPTPQAHLAHTNQQFPTPKDNNTSHIHIFNF